MATIFNTDDAVFFVGGRGAKQGDSDAGGGATKEAWGNSEKLNKNLASVMGANGDPLSDSSAWNGSKTSCTVTSSGGGKVLINKTGAFEFVKEGLIANVKFAGVYSDGRYRVNSSYLTNDTIEIELVYSAGTTCDVKVGGAFNRLQNALDNTDAGASTPHNVHILTNKTETFIGYSDQVDIDTGGGDGSAGTWKRIIGVDDYGAEMIALQLISTDPNGLNREADEAVEMIKKVADAIDVPLIVWGTANHDKDTDVLRKAAEVCQGSALIIGPVEEGDHKRIGAAALGYQHTVIASTPIDINLAKQLNILLGNLGVPDNLLVIDPTVSGIGYGIEYCYSVMERIRMAALTQQDEKLQFPLICNISKEAWKTKEVKISENDDPTLGNPKKRGILLEAMSATVLLLAGADVLIMRHPEAIKLVRETIAELTAS